MTDRSRSQWYLGNASGEREGPFSSDEIVNMRLASGIADDTPCWRQGMSEWTPLGQVASLAALIDFRRSLGRRRVWTVTAWVAVAVLGLGAGAFALFSLMGPKSAAHTERNRSGAPNDAAPLPPELEPLDLFRGTWEHQVISHPSECTPERTTMSCTETKEWTLGGRLLQGYTDWSPTGLTGFSLMAYDTRDHAYRQWYFDSNGALPADGYRGQWDEATRTFTFKDMSPDGATSLLTCRFVGNDKYEWTLRTTDATGKVLVHLEATAKRQ